MGCLLEGRPGCHGEGKAGTLEDQQGREMQREGDGIGCLNLALTRSD